MAFPPASNAALATVAAIVMLGMLVGSGIKNVDAQSCDGVQAVMKLGSCLPAVKSNPAPPSFKCCDMVNKLSADCLCSALQSSAAKLEGVNLQIALQLPRKCKRAVPKGSTCAGYTIPG